MELRHANSDEHNDGRAAVDPRIPLYLVTGHASRSKADLLQQIALRAGGRVALALMSESFRRMLSANAVPLSSPPDIVRLPSGSICIDAGADPICALYQLHLRRLELLEPHLTYGAIVIEVGENFETGAFAAVIQNDTRLDVTNRITGIINAVDVRECPFRNSDDQLQKIGEADTIVLAGGYDASSDIAERSRAAISTLNPFALVIGIDDFNLGRLPLRRMDPGMFSGAAVQRLCREHGMVSLPAAHPDITVVAGNLYNDAQCNEASAGPVRAMRMRIPGELSLMSTMQAMREICIAHGPDVLRLLAVLNVRNADHPVALDVIGGTLIHPSYHSRTRRSDSDISVIGRNLDIPRTMEAFSSSRWNSVTTVEDLRAAL